MKKAFVLASGFGKKMWPYSHKWQKCCLPICNVSNTERIIINLEALEINDITVIASYNYSQVKYCLRKHSKVTVIKEDNPSGTAVSLLKAIENSNCNEDFLVMYGDILVDLNSLRNLLSAYKQYGPSIMVQNINGDINTVENICASVDHGEIKAIYGHPRRHYVNRKIVGVFALNSTIVSYLENNPGRMYNVCVGGMPSEEAMLEQSLQMQLEDGLKLHAVEISKYCVDLDYPWSLLEANKLIIKETLDNLNSTCIVDNSSIDPTAVINGSCRLGKGSRIGKHVIIKGDLWVGDNTIIDYGAILEGNNIIGDNCSISDYCMIGEYTTIGCNNKIGFSAQVQGITFDHVSIVHNSEVSGIVGTHTDIAAGVMMGSLRFDDSYTNKNAGGYGNAVFVGDYVRTGVSNIFYPGVKVGSNCALGPGSIIDNDVEANSLILVEQSKIHKTWGPERYSW